MTVKLTIQNKYEIIVDNYIHLFCDKHDLDYDNSDWIGGRIGEMYENADNYFLFDDIRFDIDNNLPENMIIEWDEATYEHRQKYPKSHLINLISWKMGLRYQKPDGWIKHNKKRLIWWFKWHTSGKREMKNKFKEILKELHY